MKPKLMLAIMPLICVWAVFSQNRFDAEVHVVDFDDVPIPNATVELYDTNDVFLVSGKTDYEGEHFSLNMGPGKYHIKLRKGGEIVKERTINLPVLEGRRLYNRVRIFVLYEERKQFTIENLLFEYNSAHIYSESHPILNKVVDYLKNTDGSFEIAGHTDNVGTDADNLVLSQNRANAVKEYLVAHGIKEDRLVPIGYGESVPVDTNETNEGRANNRRTELKLLE